jgi:predicted DCC family thiol-disulfide oxidoreductase YuxK
MCYLCNGFVNFLIRHDKHDLFLFATLQSVNHPDINDEIKKNISSTDSIALITDGKIYFRSEAVLRVFKKLGGGWIFFYALIIFPKPFCDWLYDVVARNRYRWFGRKDVCMVPDEKVKRKFIGF